VVHDFPLFLSLARVTKQGMGGEGGVGGEYHKCEVGLGNAVFYGMVGLGITAAKFASQVVQFCCYSVFVENCVSET